MLVYSIILGEKTNGYFSSNTTCNFDYAVNRDSFCTVSVGCFSLMSDQSGTDRGSSVGIAPC